VHGIATWFDVAFVGSTCQRILSTSPGVPLTHWYQLRCVLMEPIHIRTPGETIKGTLRLKAHARQSYDVLLDVWGPGGQRSSGCFDLKEPYYRQLVYNPAAVATATAVAAPTGADIGGGDSRWSQGGEDPASWGQTPGEDTWWV